MHIYEMVEMVRTLTARQSTSGSVPSRTGFADDQEIARLLNMEQAAIVNRIQNFKKGHLIRTTTFDTTSTGVFELPVNVKGRPIHIRREDQSAGKIRNEQIALGESWFYESDLHVSGHERFEYYYNITLGPCIKAVPNPGATGSSGAFKMWYQWNVPNLHWGTAAAGAATTMTLESALWVDKRDDYYNGIPVYLVGGTGDADPPSIISDYTGSTRVATINFTNTPDATSIYSMASPIPEQHHMLMVVGAAKWVRIKAREKADDLIEEYKQLNNDLVTDMALGGDIYPKHTETDYDDLMEA